jgi:hypothetical protein
VVQAQLIECTILGPFGVKPVGVVPARIGEALSLCSMFRIAMIIECSIATTARIGPRRITPGMKHHRNELPLRSAYLW